MFFKNQYGTTQGSKQNNQGRFSGGKCGRTFRRTFFLDELSMAALGAQETKKVDKEAGRPPTTVMSRTRQTKQELESGEN